MPPSIASCTMPTGSRSRARASAKPPPGVRSLTASRPTDLMTTPTRDPASPGGRHHRNARPASIGTGGRLRPESPADFIGMRMPSAKMTVWNEAMYYFHVAPDIYRKILFVLKHSRRDVSLASYYLKTHEHLVPNGVEVWEYDTCANTAERLR